MRRETWLLLGILVCLAVALILSGGIEMRVDSR